MNGKQMKTTVKSITLAIMDPEFRARKNYAAPTVTFHGPKGAGKSVNVKEAGTEINVPVINIRLGQELAEDMSFPEISENEGEKYLGKVIAEQFPRYKIIDGHKVPRKKLVDGEIVVSDNEYQIDFESIATYIDNYAAIKEYYDNLGNGMTINDAPGGILFLDELNRVEDKQMFQMIFQLFDSGKFKGFVLPEEISKFAACNPNDGYIVRDWFADPAFSNRCIHLKTEYDFESWLAFADRPDSGYDETTLDFYKTHPEALFDVKENNFEIPQMSRSFRNGSYLSLYVDGVDYGDDQIETLMLSAIVGPEFVSQYKKVKEKVAEKVPTIEELLTTYDEFEIGEEPVIKTKTGEQKDGTPVYSYEIGTLKDFMDPSSQEAVSPVRSRMLRAVEQNPDYYNTICNKLVEFIHEGVLNDDLEKREEVRNLVLHNRKRLWRFLFDLPKGKYGTTMQQLIANKEVEQNVIIETTNLMTAAVETDPDEGQYFIEMAKYANSQGSEYRKQ